MKNSLFGAIDAYIKYKRVPRLISDPYKNRKLFTCVVNNLSKRLGRDMHKFFSSPLSLRDRRDKFPNVYLAISKVNKRVASLMEKAEEDTTVLNELQDLKLISYVNKLTILGD